jgi:hypothetical protein
VALGTVALLTACGTGSQNTGSPSTGATSGKGATVRTDSGPGTVPTCAAPAAAAFGAVDASFSSASDGWLLGITPAACTPYQLVQMRKTTDGGLKWTKVAAPAAPWSDGPVTPPGGVTAVLFANAKDGWVYGPGLWATHNGGASWHQVSTHGYAVYSMAVTGTSVVAAFDKCGMAAAGCDNPKTFKVETAPVHTDTWRAVRGASGPGAPRVTARAGAAYAYGVITSASATAVKLGLLTGPANGSKAWHSAAIPCPQGAITASAATATHVLLGCALLGAHPATTHLYSSTDSGAKWKQFATLGLYDGASLIEETPNGTLLVGGIYNGIELSRDGGRTWTSPAAVDGSDWVQGGGEIEAALVSNADGYVLVAQGPLWITRDGGKTWTRVKVS